MLSQTAETAKISQVAAFDNIVEMTKITDFGETAEIA